MPAYNSAATLADSATSVLAQSMGDLELVIADDGSTDETAAVAARLAAGDARVRVLHLPGRSGPAGARNAAIAVARGRYLAFCDSDDAWLPTKLERQLAVAASSGAPLVFSAYHRVDAGHTGGAAGPVPSGRVVYVPAQVTHRELLRRNVIGCLTAMVDLEQTGPITMPDIPGAEDWATWLGILRDGGAAVGIDEPLALYRTDQAGSHSRRRWRAAYAVWRVLREQEGLDPVRAAFHLVTDAVAALRKTRI